MVRKKRSLFRWIGYFFIFVFFVELWSEVEKLPTRIYAYLLYLSIGIIVAQRVFRMLKTSGVIKVSISSKRKRSVANPVGWICLMFLLIAIGYALSNIETAGKWFIALLCVSGGLVAARLAYKHYKRHQVLKSGIDKIDLMTGEDFEKFLELQFNNKRYSVVRTSLSGDFGADLIIEKDGARTAVQAKRYSDKVGLSAVQEVVAAMSHYNCKNGMVVTNNFYTPQATALALSNKIILWDRNELIKEILR